MYNEFTFQQKKNWGRFEKVKHRDEINMLDVDAGCQLSGLQREEWIFCLQNDEKIQDEILGKIAPQLELKPGCKASASTADHRLDRNILAMDELRRLGHSEMYIQELYNSSLALQLVGRLQPPEEFTEHQIDCWGICRELLDKSRTDDFLFVIGAEDLPEISVSDQMFVRRNFKELEEKFNDRSRSPQATDSTMG